MKTEVVEVVTGQTMAEIRAARDRVREADLVELRLDFVADIDVAGALEGRTTPVIVTCRPAWEGGRFNGSEEERLGFLSKAIQLGAEYVDVEWQADWRQLPRNDRTTLIMSQHDFSGVTADLTGRVRAMGQAAPDAITKVAVAPARLRDCLALRDLDWATSRHIVIAMGAAGQLTRLCPWLFDSCWTYGGAAAPGQVPAADLLQMYRVGARTRRTAIYAIGGAPLGHSASPAMHNPAFAAIGLDAVYVPLETADADEFLEVADAISVEGVSITAPLKSTLFARVTAADDLSKRIGAVNTLRRGKDGWEACNFDRAGFFAPLERRGRSLKGARAVVLGAGGAARTVVWTLQAAGAHVEVAARRRDRAERLAVEFGAQAVDWPPAPGWDLLVNTTPVGTWPATAESPLSRDHLSGRCVYDLVYNPPETTLLSWARAAGAEVIGGLEMLVSQACHQFHWWTDREAPAATIEAAARAFLARSEGRGHD